MQFAIPLQPFMGFVKDKWRYIVELVMLLISLCLTWSYASYFGWPSTSVVLIYCSWLLYIVVQFKFKLGLTLPFVFIVVCMILAILDWNENQAIKSFDLVDYQLAIAYVLHALNGVVIYFENKMRW
jgi:hypothetical protein